MNATISKSCSVILVSLVLATLFFGVERSNAFDGETVEIIRDSWGIPHVFANTSEGAFFGLGYATAENRMFQMEYSRRIVQGRISEIIGESGVDSDKLWRTLGWYRVAREVENNLDLETRKLLQAYANGVNYYLEERNDDLLYLFDDYGIRPDPWTGADSIACWYRIALRFSGINSQEVSNLHTFEELVQQVGWDEAIAQMSNPPIIDESGAIVRQEDMAPDLIAEIEEYAEAHGYGGNINGTYSSSDALPKASHAWVVGGGRSTTGSAVLHSDPQILISAPSVWYEFHICGGSFDARGIGVAGAPGMLIGWNRDIAWGATAALADVSDLFKLEINPLNTNQYYYDDAYRDMEINEEEIRLRNGTVIPITCRKTIWGPVVTSLVAYTEPSEEFALKYAEVHNTSICSLQALIKMMKADGWESFEKAIENYLSPTIHGIYGDRYGNIGYVLLAGIPLRSTEWPLYGTMAQPGNSSAYDWQELIPKKYLPHMLNPSGGVISTANNMAVGSWYPLPLGTGTGDTARSWRLRELLDVLPEFSQDDVLAIHRDMVDPTVREIVRLARHMVHVLGYSLSQETMNAVGVLDSWNGEYNTSQTAYPLIENFNLMFRRSTTPLVLTYGGGAPGLCYFAKTLKSSLDGNPNYVPTSDEKAYVDSLLKNAWLKTVIELGGDPSQWLRYYDRTISIKYQNGLENFGSLDPRNDCVSPDLTCKHTETIWSQHGNSYSQNVIFNDVDLSKSLMPPGVSEDPDDPFFDDEMPLWVAGELHEAPLSRERIVSMMTSRECVRAAPVLNICDLNGDGIVDIFDIRKCAKAYGSMEVDDPTTPWNETENWNPDADLNLDGIINIFELRMIAKHYLEHV